MTFSTVGVVGSGPIGCAVAIACAAEGLPVTLVTATPVTMESVRARLGRRLALWTESLTDDRRSIETRITISPYSSSLIDHDLVIDAMQCSARTRRAVLATIESRMSEGAVLATCAKADQLPEIAEALRRPDQLVGIRFALPVATELRLELSWLPESAPGVAAACRAFIGQLRKTATETDTASPRVGYREWLSVPPPPLPDS